MSIEKCVIYKTIPFPKITGIEHHFIRIGNISDLSAKLCYVAFLTIVHLKYSGLLLT